MLQNSLYICILIQVHVEPLTKAQLTGAESTDLDPVHPTYVKLKEGTQ